MSRFEQWLPFFEQASARRDTLSWWEVLKSELGKFGVNVKLIVSDRASALIKLGNKEYLNAFSMPDLFHFMQDISRCVGAKLHSQKEKIDKSLKKEGLSNSEKETLAAIKIVREFVVRTKV